MVVVTPTWSRKRLQVIVVSSSKSGDSKIPPACAEKRPGRVRNSSPVLLPPSPLLSPSHSSSASSESTAICRFLVHRGRDARLSFARRTSCRTEHPYSHLLFDGPCDNVIFLWALFGFSPPALDFSTKATCGTGGWLMLLVVSTFSFLTVSVVSNFRSGSFSHCLTLRVRIVRHISEKLAA